MCTMTETAEQPFHSGFISLIGRPNAGKSTLLNRLVGEKIAITSAKPQTTRNRIQGICNLPQAQIVFVDTPGIHRARSRLNKFMVSTAMDAMMGGDLVLLLMPADLKPENEAAFIREIVAEANQPVALVLTKIDLLPRERLLPLIDHYQHLHDFLAILPVSAVTGAGVDELVRVVVAQLPEGPAYFPTDILTDLPERFLAGETVREKLFQFTRDEVPYSAAVVVDRFFERPDGLIEIDAVINVERDSQKGVIIGKGGAMLKKIGTAARKDLEEFLQARVFLQLFVRVQKEWSENSHLLKEFGY